MERKTLTFALIALALLALPSSAAAVPQPEGEMLNSHATWSSYSTAFFNTAPVPSYPAWQEHISNVLRHLYPKASTQLVEDRWHEAVNPSSVILTHPEIAHHETPVTPREQKISISILETVEPNAFALPADSEAGTPARVLLSRGLLVMMETYSELAFVLAHELAHVEHDHFAPGVPLSLFSGHQLARIAEVHRGWEHQADTQALELIAQRGFDQKAVVWLLERLAYLEIRAEDPLLSFHPEISQRISRIEPTISREFAPASAPFPQWQEHACLH